MSYYVKLLKNLQLLESSRNYIIKNKCRLFSSSISRDKSLNTTQYSAVSRETHTRCDGNDTKRLNDETDVLIVGCGAAGLSAAIKLKQLANSKGKELRVRIVGKDTKQGLNTLYGACIEPFDLSELIPDWKDRESPSKTHVTEHLLSCLTETKRIAGTVFKVTPFFNNSNYLVRLGYVMQCLAEQAEQLGVEIYSGIAANEVLYDQNGCVVGIDTNDDKDRYRSPMQSFERRIELNAKCTIFAEGCHGSLAKQLYNRFNLKEKCEPQTFCIGLNEIWEIDPSLHRPGRVEHSFGWPLDNHTFGGSFIYHINEESPQISIGFVVEINGTIGYLSPYNEFQRFKSHPYMKRYFESKNAKRIAYGSRTWNEVGYQSIPKLTFPGGCLIGCCAGLTNIPKINGTHNDMESGMIAAQTIFEAFDSDNLIIGYEPKEYETKLKHSIRFPNEFSNII